MIPGSRLRPGKPVANVIDCFLVYIAQAFYTETATWRLSFGQQTFFSTIFPFSVLEMLRKQTFCKMQGTLFFTLPAVS